VKTGCLNGTALLIIDMLNDYLTPQGGEAYGPVCREIIPSLVQLSDFVRSNGGIIAYANTSLSSRDLLVSRWGRHAISGTTGAEVIEELSPRQGDVVCPKKFYDAFFKTKLDEELREKGISQIVLSGIHTHVCVLISGIGAFQRGYNVVAPSDCFTTGHKANHESRLRFFGSHIGQLTTSSDWMKSVVAKSG
jgi:nicotinamidase-related amidase